MNFGAPQIVYLMLVTSALTFSALDHGKPMKNENFFTTLIALAIQVAVLGWGGFFTHH